MKLSRQLPVNALRVFEAAARLGSFSKAADELGMTQTAVSYQIKLLEGHIGKPLFIRQPRQTVLTETGQLMLPKIAEGLGCLAEGVGIARKSSSEALELNAIPTLASRWLARHLGGFHLAHPQFSVRLQRVMKTTDFNASSADVAIEWIQSERPDLAYVDIATPTFSPVLTPSLAARIGGVREPADLLKLPRLSAKDRMWQAWFAEAGVENPTTGDDSDNGYESQDLEVYAALEDHGVALVARFFFQDELASGRLVQPFQTTVKSPYRLVLVYPKARRNAGKIKAFRDWIIATLHADIATFEGARQP